MFQLLPILVLKAVIGYIQLPFYYVLFKNSYYDHNNGKRSGLPVLEEEKTKADKGSCDACICKNSLGLQCPVQLRNFKMHKVKK